MKVILSLLFTFSILVSYSQDNSNIGESRLINNCADGVQCSEYDHGKNLRTEFRIVEIGGKSVNLGADNSNTTRADDSNNSNPAPTNSGGGFKIE